MEQIAAHLRSVQKLLHQRSWKPQCFTIISEFPHKKQRRPPDCRDVEIEVAPDDRRESHLDWRLCDELNRYVQFAFEGDWFYVELPVETLGPNDGQRLVMKRTSFFYLRDRPDVPSAFSHDAWAKLVAEHNPVQKLYKAAEILQAAEDAA